MSAAITGKKRPRTEFNAIASEQEKKQGIPAPASFQGSMDLPSPIRKLRLEAIFHPKFENENRSDKAVRREMMERVEKQQGYLEVTLKHSGSLVLWSGHSIYSKNSVDNQYTYAAEILIRQHFERAWRKKTNAKHDECSQFLTEKRLTLAFEVVTAVLGDHGDRPRKDFVMLTAVADRSRERFYSTSEAIQLAQRFRLPHNDIWFMSTRESVAALFSLYDTTRETGKARDTIRALSSAAEATVPSMYPHEEFQGDILEGIIIRYVPYKDSQDIASTRRVMDHLSSEAYTILEDVPTDLPFSFELDFEESRRSSVYTSNLRQISKTCGGFSTIENGENKFQDALYQVLSTNGPRPTFQRHSDKSIDFPKMTEHLTMVSEDVETCRIACMLQLVGSLNKPVSYVVVKEKAPDGQIRWLCIVHVHNDETFRQYHIKRNHGIMNLFRGFCIEINGTETNEVGVMHMPHDDMTESSDRTDDFLMLKMKFLPYMTRTFLCRNTLRMIEKEGPFKYYRFIESMLNRWAVSAESKRKLIPFLQSWAVFAHSALTASSQKDRTQLSQSNYLGHLEEFSKLYKEGKAPKPVKPNYEGAVIVVAPQQGDAEGAARIISQILEVKASPLAPDTLLIGSICYCSIFSAVNKLTKKRIGQMSDTLSVIFLGFDEEDLNARVAEGKDRGKALGFSKSWKNYDCAAQIDLRLRDIPSCAENVNCHEEFSSCIHQLKSAIERDTDEKSRGILVFFPGLPGCGKSTIVENLKEEQGPSPPKEVASSRKVHVLEGDAVGKSFWSQLRKMRRADSRCIMVADKNAPPNSLKLIGLNCHDTNGIPVAVIPDNSALETTHIKGATLPDGEISPDSAHFYPFSLSYLAVCMSRVLQRPPKSHRGKLDQSTPNACMILVLFFSLYRSISAEAFYENIDSKVASGGAVGSLKPIVLPFLRNAMNQPLPDDLRSELVAAIQLQRGYDIRKKKPKASDNAISRMEKRLRESMDKHRHFLSQLAVDPADSERIFYEQLAQRVCALDAGTGQEQFVKLASIDLDRKRIHQILIENSSSCTKDFLEMALKTSTDDFATQDGCYTDSQFVTRPHITLLHHNDFDQHQIKQKFAHLQGCTVNIVIKAFLWNAQVAAFAVDVEETTIDGQVMLQSQNKFVHVTVWCAAGEKPFMSNELADMVINKTAHHVDYAEPIKLQGKLTFWDMTNTPIII